MSAPPDVPQQASCDYVLPETFVGFLKDGRGVLVLVMPRGPSVHRIAVGPRGLSGEPTPEPTVVFIGDEYGATMPIEHPCGSLEFIAGAIRPRS